MGVAPVPEECALPQRLSRSAPYERSSLSEMAKKLGLGCHSRGTMLTTEGLVIVHGQKVPCVPPKGADVINMTAVPEVLLAKKAGLSGASIAMATD